MSDFRFEDLKIWQFAIEISNSLFDIADGLEKQKMFRFAEQLRGAGMSISNNIAEGSASTSNKEFAQFLNYSRRSAFECANIIIILEKRKMIDTKLKKQVLEKLIELSKMITSFRRSLQ